MKKSTKNLLFLTSAVIAGMHIYNRVVDSNAERKNALKNLLYLFHLHENDIEDA